MFAWKNALIPILKNPEKFYTEKKTKHAPSGFSLFTNCSFDSAENNLDWYKGEDCMEKFCKYLREHEVKIISHEKTEMIKLTDAENKSYEDQKVCYIYKKNDDDGDDDDDDDDKKVSKSKRSLSLHWKI